MSYANGTTHYNLPQTVGTDKRDWFDTNDAFASVDAALNTAYETAASTASNVSALADRVTANEGDIADIKDFDTNIDGRVSALSDSILAVSGDVDNVKQDLTDAICSVVEGSATAAYNHAVGSYFWYNDTLYITTVAIDIGDTIVPNTNCDTVTVSTEIQSIKPDSSGSVSVDATGKTIGQVFNQIFNGLDLTKIKLGRSRLEIDGIRQFIVTQNTNNVVSFMSFATTDTFIYGYLAANSSVCVYYTFSNSTATDKTNDSAGNGTYIFYY